ncbi:hypothetical protein [Aquisphaera insulae]|uniref:hypothetical protein n=1 Tax=Aquisphaera insulae TaxID=2712864 RepID=UPI0013ED44CE|nr:hypothetical protein [Aquisphaera insulae]
MDRSNSVIARIDAPALDTKAQQVSPDRRDAGYRSPRLVAGAKAVDVILGGSYGAYEDSYSGYKWNR